MSFGSKLIQCICGKKDLTQLLQKNMWRSFFGPTVCIRFRIFIRRQMISGIRQQVRVHCAH